MARKAEWHNHRQNSKRRGIIIYLVAIVITILSLGAFALFATITMERNATQIRGNEIQVNAAAQSGTEFVRAVCNATAAEQNRMGGLVNSPRHFAGVEVLSLNQGVRQNVFRFTILSPKIDFSSSGSSLNGVRYGLQNESARLHLDTVLKWESESPGQGRRALLTLPGMTPTSADSILDWIDPDKRARPSGAEVDYYQRIGVPYGPRNATPVSLEELLLVRGVNRLLLFGTDESFTYGFSHAGSSSSSGTTSNPLARTTDVSAPNVPEIPGLGATEPDMSAVDTSTLSLRPDKDQPANPSILAALESGEALDSNLLEAGALDTGTLSAQIPSIGSASVETSETGSSLSDSSRGDRGLPWVYLLTTLSAEKEVNPSGIVKFDLNGNNEEYLRQEISRMVDQRAAEFVLLYRKSGVATESLTVTLETPMELLIATPPQGTTNPFAQTDSQGKERFYKLLDYATTNRDVIISGRINVNEAPPEVLRAIPGFNDSLVSRIVSRRSSLIAAGRQNELRHPVWLFYEQLLTAEQMKSLWPTLTCGGDVYRCQVVGFLENQGTSSRFEIVIDSTVRPPRQIFFKDLTMYGRGFPLSVLNPTK